MMTPKTMILIAAGAAALALPAAASAQPYGYGYGHRYDRGDYDGDRWGGFRGYPEFRGIEAHISREIEDGLRDRSLSGREVWHLRYELNRIRGWEAQELREHGWDLPYGERLQIRAALDRLDGQVDRARDDDWR